MSESIDHSWICREDFGIERNQSFKGDHGNAQFSLCCTSTAMPDDDSQDRHPAFCFYFLEIEKRKSTLRNSCGGIAQLVERQLCKLEVRGSNPLASKA